MSIQSFRSQPANWLRVVLGTLALLQMSIGPALAGVAAAGNPSSFADNNTATPIKHVIVIIGENRSFDHVFATYVPKQPGVTVRNLLSEGIIALDANKNAIPGPNLEQAHQLAATDMGASDPFLLSPPKQEFPNNQLPAPLVGGPKVSYIPNECGPSTPIAQCAASLTLAQQSESGLPASYYQDLLTGGTGQTKGTPDQRITNVNALPAGPFQLTNGSTFVYDDYAQSPVHRFYQMWQQLNCSVSRSTRDNPSGCDEKLFSWVEVTVGAGTDGTTQPAVCNPSSPAKGCFSTNYPPGATTTGEGSTALGFYNVQKGDVPYFTSLAQQYAMSDNFHQSVNGGTGANHIMFGHGDMIWFSDANGNPAVPPNGADGVPGHARRGRRPPDREPRSGDGHEQLVHGGRLRRPATTRAIRRHTPTLPSTAADPTATARIPISPACGRSSIISPACRARSIRTASRATTTCSTTTTRVTSATARTPTSTTTRRTRRSRFRLHRRRASATT